MHVGGDRARGERVGRRTRSLVRAAGVKQKNVGSEGCRAVEMSCRCRCRCRCSQSDQPKTVRVRMSISTEASTFYLYTSPHPRPLHGCMRVQNETLDWAKRLGVNATRRDACGPSDGTSKASIGVRVPHRVPGNATALGKHAVLWAQDRYSESDVRKRMRCGECYGDCSRGGGDGGRVGEKLLLAISEIASRLTKKEGAWRGH
jgi:hypothetical protein